MRFLCLQWSVLIVVFSLTFGAQANNYHEHLFSLPFAEDIVPRSAQIFSLPPDRQRFSAIFDSYGEYMQFLEAFEFSPEILSKYRTRPGFERTLSELCRDVSQRPEEVLERLLQVDERAWGRRAQHQYFAAGELRKMILLHVDEATFLKIMESYLHRDGLENRAVILASASRRVFTKRYERRLAAFKDLAWTLGTRLLLLANVQRKDWFNDRVTAEGQGVFVRHPLVDGIDLSGSLHDLESLSERPQTQKALVRKVIALFDYVADHSLIFRLHAFEFDNKGPFYQALEVALKTYERPLKLNIGHALYLNRRWLRVLTANKNLDVAVDMNVAANTRLGPERALERLQRVYRDLSRHQIEVFLGSDGRGVLPGSALPEQMRRLGLSQQSLERHLDTARTFRWQPTLCQRALGRL